MIRRGVVLAAAAAVGLLAVNVSAQAQAGAPAAAAAVTRAADLDAWLAWARAAHRPVALTFHAAWCAACRLLDRHTLADREVVAALARFTVVRIDTTDDVADDSGLAARFAVTRLPAIVFLGSDGKLAAARVTGFVSPRELLAVVRGVR